MSKILIPKGVKIYYKSPSGETACTLQENYLANVDFESDTNVYWLIQEEIRANTLSVSERVDFTLTKGERIWMKRGEESPQEERFNREIEEDRILTECEKDEDGREVPFRVALNLYERGLRNHTDVKPSLIRMTQGTKMEFLKSMMFESVLDVVDEVRYLLSFEGYYMMIIVDNDLKHGDFRME